jgi:hypothetical protein
MGSSVWALHPLSVTRSLDLNLKRLHSKSKEQGDSSDSCKLNNYIFLWAVLISAHGLISTCLPNRWFKHRSQSITLRAIDRTCRNM